MNIDRLSQFYDELYNQSEPVVNDPEAEAIGARVVEANIGNIVLKFKWALPQQTYMREDLEKLDCIVQERRGTGTTLSKWLLCIHPREAQHTDINDPRRLFAKERNGHLNTAIRAAKPRDMHLKNLGVQDQILQDQINDLRKEVEMLKSMASLVPDLMLAIRKIETRLAVLEGGEAA